jgi:hypothetical protein
MDLAFNDEYYLDEVMNIYIITMIVTFYIG